jgi:hypothetical protein
MRLVEIGTDFQRLLRRGVSLRRVFKFQIHADQTHVSARRILSARRNNRLIFRDGFREISTPKKFTSVL